MLPVLLDLKVVKIYTLGVFLVLAFFWGTYWLWRNIKLTSYKEEEVFDGFFISLTGGLFMSRLVYVLLNFQDFGFNPLRFILINGYPGLSIIGGLFGAILTFFVYARFQKMKFLHIVDYLVSPLLLALAIGKVGSFFAGTDPGRQTDFILRVGYVGLDGARHIVALYEAVLLFIGFWIAYRMIFIVRREKMVQGSAFYFFLIYFSGTQILLDFMKQNHIYLAGLSFNMIISAIVFVLTTGYVLIFHRKSVIAYTKNFTSNIKKYGNKRANKKPSGGVEESAAS